MAGKRGATVKQRSTRGWTLIQGVRRIPVGRGSGYAMIHRLARREVRGEMMLIGIAGAYDALGLIATEANGIFVLNETRQEVVLDEHAKASSGYYGASPSQLREYELATSLSPVEFIRWARANPRCRGAHTLPEVTQRDSPRA